MYVLKDSWSPVAEGLEAALAVAFVAEEPSSLLPLPGELVVGGASCSPVSN